MTGRSYPSAAERVGRLVETVDVVTRLLAGEVVTHHGRHLHVDVRLVSEPAPSKSLSVSGSHLLSHTPPAAGVVSPVENSAT